MCPQYFANKAEVDTHLCFNILPMIEEMKCHGDVRLFLNENFHM